MKKTTKTKKSKSPRIRVEIERGERVPLTLEERVSTLESVILGLMKALAEDRLRELGYEVE
jgi:hypothetical protein